MRFKITVCSFYIFLSACSDAGIKLPQNPCGLLSAEDINRIFEGELAFVVDNETLEARKGLDELSGLTTCGWIAPPLKELDTGAQRNAAMVAVTIVANSSAKSAQEWLFITAEPFDEGQEVVRYSGLGDDAIFSTALFVRKQNVVFSVRFAPYTRWGRTDEYLEYEGKIAELILSRL